VGAGWGEGGDLSCARLKSIRPVSSANLLPEHAHYGGWAVRRSRTSRNPRWREGLDTRGWRRATRPAWAWVTTPAAVTGLPGEHSPSSRPSPVLREWVFCAASWEDCGH